MKCQSITKLFGITIFTTFIAEKGSLCHNSFQLNLSAMPHKESLQHYGIIYYIHQIESVYSYIS